MFILIHGEDQVKTRQELQNQISKTKQSGITDIITLDGKSAALDSIIQNLESGSMFGVNDRLCIIENTHKNRSKTELKEVVTYLAGLEPKSINCILWEDHELTPGQVKAISNAQVIQIKLSPAIFKLTDALVPNTHLINIIPLLITACDQDSPEMVITMLARQLRLMIQTFDPAAKIPPWQKAKLTTAAHGFSLPRLISLHHQLAQIDLHNKTGKRPSNLQSELISWLINLYAS
jgi:DNA polymerase III delta subunit